MKTKKMTNRRPRKTSASRHGSAKKFTSAASSGRRSRLPRRRSGSRRSGSKSSKVFDVAGFIALSNTKHKNQPTIASAPAEITHSFSDFDIPQELQDALKEQGFNTPTEIQDQAIPEILSGSDVVGIANTGTGKTLAFVLPVAAKIIAAGRDDRGRRRRALIMCPTRELAQQVEAEVAKLTAGSKVYSLVCVGGMPIGRQIRKLNQRPEFVIGTPGRLKDLLDRGELDLSAFNYAVLDEADRMLDMGFVNDMRYILDHFKTGHQTLLFSATFSDDIKCLVSDFTKNALTVSVKRRETARTVDQSVVAVSGFTDKVEQLASIVSQDETGKTIVFCRTKRGSDRLARDLRSIGINAESIHGDKPQRLRTKLLNRFRSHSITVLVATDVAARGLDVDDITHVINFDAPQTQDDYVHRIGRTGRAGSQGSAITFVDA